MDVRVETFRCYCENSHLVRVTAAFTLTYDFPHDLAADSVLNVLGGVPPK